MIKRKILNWILLQLESSERFNLFIEKKISNYYQLSSLNEFRVWGDVNKIKFGISTQVNNTLFNTVSGTISIGDYTFCGHNVSIFTGTHNYKYKNFDRQAKVPTEGRDIVIGKGVWLASNCIIIGPCNIGDNCVIGAGCLVTGDIESNTIYTNKNNGHKRSLNNVN